MRILALEPYFGGSHRTFLQGLQQVLPMEIELLTLPARKWKWRMRLAAPLFAERMAGMGRFDRILCSTFVDVAALRGLAPSWVRDVPVCTYFHENQFAYPVQVEDERDLHFGLTNITTGLASDRLAFNSAYNLESFLRGAAALLKQAPDMNMTGAVEQLRAKARVLPLGIDFSRLDRLERPDAAAPGSAPVIVWNHRWEHDKDPETFFATLIDLDQQGVDFRLVVLGQSFARQPAIFNEARSRLAHRILHFGYVIDNDAYYAWLKRGDVVVSTARHEFYGIAVIEAVRAGCRPLLPDRLSYPELFADEYRYAPGELGEALRAVLTRCGSRFSGGKPMTDRFAWSILAPQYAAWLT